MADRHTARLWALQILYRLDINATALPAAFDDFRNGHAVDEKAFAFTIERVRGVREHLKELDQCIEQSAENWRLPRMGFTDRNILRLGVYELLKCPEIPPAVIIDQAIILAKKFGSEESGKFVNGVLDRINRTYRNKRAN